MSHFIAAALLLITIVLLGASWSVMEWPFAAIPVAVSPLAFVGALLVYRIPRNLVGWLLGFAGMLLMSSFILNGYAWAALVREHGRWPGGESAAAVASAFFAPALGAAVVILLFFPTGRGLGGRWTWVERAFIAVLCTIAVTSLLRDVPIEVSGGTPDAITFPNPFALHGPAGDLVTLLGHLGDSWTAPLLLVGPLSLFIRYRRSGVTEREQIKWLVYAGSLAFALIVASNFMTGDLSNWVWALGTVALGLLPIAIAVAIFRYRLYDIDVLIRRTLIYASVSAVLLGTYLAAVALLELVLAPVTAGSSVAVAISTLAVVALFQPLRRRVQAAVDRRFYRAKYDADVTLDAFASRLRDEVDLTALQEELLAVVGDTMRPERASVWLREGSAAAD
ncbi:MAG TPA: hypothetical protein VKR80_10670 [Candidatus Limnocylindria bacterium]|nr:hypothetical protein [Candidatus Limnocylindria bacterium]